MISEAAPARKAKPGETWDPVKKIGADGTVGIDPALGQLARELAGRSSSATSSSSATRRFTATTRSTCTTCPATSAASTCAPASSSGSSTSIPQPGEFGAETWENGSKIGTTGVGKVDAWAPYSADPDLGTRVHPGRHGRSSTSTAAIVRATTCSAPASSRSTSRPASASGTTSSCITTSGTTTRRWRRTCSTSPSTDSRARSSRRRRSRDGCTRSIASPVSRSGRSSRRRCCKSDVPGEKTSPTQPIPSKPAPFSQQGLVESDLIDYTPEIKAAALALAKQCRMGPYFIPDSANDGTTRVPVLVVRAGRERRRQHRRRHGGRSRDRHHLRRRADRASARSALAKIRARSSRITQNTLRSDRRAASAAGIHAAAVARGAAVCAGGEVRRRR